VRARGGNLLDHLRKKQRRLGRMKLCRTTIPNHPGKLSIAAELADPRAARPREVEEPPGQATGVRRAASVLCISYCSSLQLGVGITRAERAPLPSFWCFSLLRKMLIHLPGQQMEAMEMQVS
jgi:hypothetical protein